MTARPSSHRAAVLGHPVAHSLSPLLHRAAYDALGLPDWTYAIHDVDEPDLAGFVASLDDAWAGLSLTMPLKQVALQVVDVVQPLAQAVGAVNTIVFQAGRLLVGANTDVYGLVAALREAAPVGVGATIDSGVVIGGGATAASALAAFGELGLHRPQVLVRNQGRAGAVLRAAAAMGVEPQLIRLGTPAATAALSAAEVVISTVPGAASDSLVSLLDGMTLGPEQRLLDVVYEGWPRPFPLRWRELGGSVAPGYLMLLHQACEQVRLMTGRAAPVDAMRAALLGAIAP